MLAFHTRHSIIQYITVNITCHIIRSLQIQFNTFAHIQMEMLLNTITKIKKNTSDYIKNQYLK